MPITATALATLAETKAFLNITVSTYDTLLPTFINAASQMIQNRIGVIAGSPTVEEWHDGGSETIVLRNTGPIQSVTTVTETVGSIVNTLAQVTLDAGSTGSAYAYTVDLDHGVLVRRASGMAMPFMFGVRNIHITYVAGYASIPADIHEAALELTKHLWESQRGSGKRPATGPVNSDGPAPGFWPPRVTAILEPYFISGIA